MSKCIVCNGKGYVDRPQCMGRGRISNGFGGTYECVNCKGTGRKERNICNGKGYK